MDAIQQLDFPCTCSWSLYWGVSYPVDHYFLGASEHNSNGRKWLKKIQPNLSILQVLSPLQRSVQVILVVSAFLPRWTLANLMVQPGCSLTQGTKRIQDISSRRLTLMHQKWVFTSIIGLVCQRLFLLIQPNTLATSRADTCMISFFRMATFGLRAFSRFIIFEFENNFPKPYFVNNFPNYIFFK